MTMIAADAPPVSVRAVLLTTLVAALWINASEIFRYFVFVMPMLRDAFSQVENVAPVTPLIFVSWMVWDTILIVSVVGFVWLYLDRVGGGFRNAVIAGTLIWVPVFVLLWLGLLNMKLATAAIVAIAWPLSWLELVIAALIIDWGRRRFSR